MWRHWHWLCGFSIHFKTLSTNSTAVSSEMRSDAKRCRMWVTLTMQNTQLDSSILIIHPLIWSNLISKTDRPKIVWQLPNVLVSVFKSSILVQCVQTCTRLLFPHKNPLNIYIFSVGPVPVCNFSMQIESPWNTSYLSGIEMILNLVVDISQSCSSPSLLYTVHSLIAYSLHPLLSCTCRLQQMGNPYKTWQQIYFSLTRPHFSQTYIHSACRVAEWMYYSLILLCVRCMSLHMIVCLCVCWKMKKGRLLSSGTPDFRDAQAKTINKHTHTYTDTAAWIAVR